LDLAAGLLTDPTVTAVRARLRNAKFDIDFCEAPVAHDLPESLREIRERVPCGFVTLPFELSTPIASYHILVGVLRE